MPVSAPLFKLNDIPESGNRFTLGKCLNSGVRANVYEAEDTNNGNKKVAIKIYVLSPENEISIQQEYKILKNYCDHPNLTEFYGVYKNCAENGSTEIWFVMELCEGGSIMDIVRCLYNKNRRMAEEHIAFILKETTKALIHLHSHNIINRSVTGDSILLTRNGEVKLVDFGSAQELSTPHGKCSTCVGAAYWMAPEVVLSGSKNGEYGNRVDVWALGITAIELGDGKPPLDGMHPTRVMFQVVRNPPPGLYRPGGWSENYNDFVSECLEKNPEYRPYMEELLEHPFLTAIPENCYYFNQELKKIYEDHSAEVKPQRQLKLFIENNLLRTSQNLQPERMLVEDLAALENINENKLIDELMDRFNLGYFHSFVGDVLLVLNPNEERNMYDNHHQKKYTLKSRSSNPPHIFSIADLAYQDAIHQEVPQHIILSGESGSGKTTCLKHLTSHLTYLGSQPNANERGKSIEKALEVVLAFVSAGTEVCKDSTRCVLNLRIGFGPSGKVSTGKINVWQLEKTRISSTDISQSNFHMLYYFYDTMDLTGQLNIYLLDPNRNYRYLRLQENDTRNLKEIRNNPESNAKNFESIIDHLKFFSLTSDQIELINRTLAAILNLGEIRFNEIEDNVAEIENPDICTKVTELLNLDEKKFIWTLKNYCLFDQGTAIRRKNNCDQARDARDTLANYLYSRLVDWIVNCLNNKMATYRAIYGEKYFVNILDYFGFECFKRNDLEQLLVNSFNEQMQYLYNQRVFAWEMLELIEDEITPPSLNYYNNKRGIDQLLGKPTGIFALIEEASKTGHNFQYILDSIEKLNKSAYIGTTGEKEFYFSHYTGKIVYDIREMSQKNRDFLPPEMIDVLRLSTNPIIKEFFTNTLNKTGNLICNALKDKHKWTSALVSEQEKTNKLPSETQYSQTKHMLTIIRKFRSVSLEILRELSIGAGSGGTHFVRCIRTDLASNPRSFNRELIRQQLRALSVLDTVQARQLGFPHRITFPEFLRRYKFLAFDFDENVEVTKDNCRLLLVRLKMEGWVIGKSKVFLKYYNEEYLSRLYETQVKKIVKIQAMMRAFLAKRNVASKIQNLKNKAEAKLIRQQSRDLTAEATAALMIQKAYRGYNVRKKYGPLINKESGQLDNEAADFIRPFFMKWKNKSIFQVLLQYRSIKIQELINLSQQVHIFNQNLIHRLQQSNDEIDLDKIDPLAKPEIWLGDKKPSVWKLPFNFDEIPYYNTEHMCDPSIIPDEDQETWDSPLEWRRSIINEMKIKDYNKIFRPPTPNIPQNANNENLMSTPYIRNPSEPVTLETALSVISPIKENLNTKIESPKHKSIGKIQTPTSQIVISPKKIPQVSNADKNFEGANQDFEFFPSKTITKIKRRPVNPIAELESIGRKNIEKNNEDEPPFNFKGMLRKTNFQRNSLKKIPEKIEDELPYSKVLKNKVNKENIEVINKVVDYEIAPGIMLQGIETEL